MCVRVRVCVGGGGGGVGVRKAHLSLLAVFGDTPSLSRCSLQH